MIFTLTASVSIFYIKKYKISLTKIKKATHDLAVLSQVACVSALERQNFKLVEDCINVIASYSDIQYNVDDFLRYSNLYKSFPESYNFHFNSLLPSLIKYVQLSFYFKHILAISASIDLSCLSYLGYEYYTKFYSDILNKNNLGDNTDDNINFKQEDAGLNYGIFARVYNKDNVPVVPEFLVNNYTLSDQKNPTVTSLPDGKFVIEWQSIEQDCIDICLSPKIGECPDNMMEWS